LFSDAGADRIRQAHVCVVGLGGVGSWVVEALARSGLGQLTLIDLDDVCISNVNRQLHALTGEFGKPKVEVLAHRVKLISPSCRVHALHSFFLKSNGLEILNAGFDYVVDAIDSPSIKAFLIAACRGQGLRVITTGAAGGRMDPTLVEIGDLAFSHRDRLLAQVKRLLRRRHGFPRGDRSFRIEAVFSSEQVSYPEPDTCAADQESAPDRRLDCGTGLGTASFVTGTFGFVAASRVIRAIAAEPARTREPVTRVRCRSTPALAPEVCAKPEVDL
jgi:tRNA A37 threonylcarbamoyladenosine dehydratase